MSPWWLASEREVGEVQNQSLQAFVVVEPNLPQISLPPLDVYNYQLPVPLLLPNRTSFYYHMGNWTMYYTYYTSFRNVYLLIVYR